MALMRATEGAAQIWTPRGGSSLAPRCCLGPPPGTCIGFLAFVSHSVLLWAQLADKAVHLTFTGIREFSFVRGDNFDL